MSRHRILISISGVILLLIAITQLLDSLFPPPLGEHIDYSAEVLDSTNVRLRLYTTAKGYWRLPTRTTNIDPRFINFLLDYEDRRFYQHSGVNFLALLRAMGLALISGHFVSGGSTITMQTVRLIQPRPRTISSKIIELLRALQLERRLTKAQILDLYLTLTPYGGNIQGIRAASLFYFGKEPIILTLAETALLIALPQAPEMRRPDRKPKYALKGRSAVLHRLVTAGLINSADVIMATNAPLPRHRVPTPKLAPHVTDRLHSKYPRAQSLHTTINARLQRHIEGLITRRQNLQHTGITLAAIIVENNSQAIRAYVGSGDYFATTFPGQVDMIRAIRSPGSTLKPLIYGMAFDAGIAHPETLIFDRPGAIRGYAPGNFDRSYQGEIRIREALYSSRNIPAIKILDRLGTETLLQRLTAAGITLHFPQPVSRPSLPIVLGGVGIKLQDLVQIYVSIANDGISRPLNILEASTHSNLGHLQTNIPFSSSILSPTAAWYLTDILAESQPPSGFTLQRQRLAFKTGTSYGFRDAWAIGYDAAHTVGVWLGRTDNGYTPNLSGLHSAVPVLFEIFDQLPPSGLAAILRRRPPGVLTVTNSKLPENLRHFDLRAVAPLTTAATNKAPQIIYPPTGSLVEIANNPNASIHVEISSGQPPFYLLENGHPVNKSYDIRVLDWQPASDGPILLTVLDSHGRSAQTHLQVRKLSNSIKLPNYLPPSILP